MSAHATTIALDAQLGALRKEERQLRSLVQSFDEHLTAIGSQVDIIQRQAEEWELCQKRVDDTIQQLRVAQTKYELPSMVGETVSKGQEASVEDLLESTDRVVDATHHIRTTGGKSKAQRTLKQYEDFLNKLRQAMETRYLLGVKKIMPSAHVGKRHGDTESESPLRRPDAAVARDTSAFGFDMSEEETEKMANLATKLYAVFNRSTAFADEVETVLRERLRELAATRFDSRYMEEYEGPRIAKVYLKGSHPLLSVAKMCRELYAKISATLEKIAVAPTKNDSHVAPMAARVFLPPVELYLQRCIAAVDSDLKRPATESVFVALDILEDAWEWTSCLRGSRADIEMRVLVQKIDTAISFAVQELMEKVNEDLTKKAALGNAEASVHELTTSVMHYFQSLFGQYSATFHRVIPNAQRYIESCMVHHQEAIEDVAKRMSDDKRLREAAPLFEANNYFYVVEKLKKEKCFVARISLVSGLQALYLNQADEKVNEFVEHSWKYICPQQEYMYPGESTLGTAEKKIAKKWLKEFSEAFGKTLALHRDMIVPSQQLREMIRKKIKEVVAAPYSEFMTALNGRKFDSNPSHYMKYTEDDVLQIIDSLYTP